MVVTRENLVYEKRLSNYFFNKDHGYRCRCPRPLRLDSPCQFLSYYLFTIHNVLQLFIFSFYLLMYMSEGSLSRKKKFPTQCLKKDSQYIIDFYRNATF